MLATYTIAVGGRNLLEGCRTVHTGHVPCSIVIPITVTFQTATSDNNYDLFSSKRTGEIMHNLRYDAR